MKVGLVSPYDFASPGGVTDHVRNLAKALTHIGHPTQIFAPSSRRHTDSDGTIFHRIGTPVAIPVNDSVARITLTFRIANQVQSMVQRERFDVLAVVTLLLLWVGRWADPVHRPAPVPAATTSTSSHREHT